MKTTIYMLGALLLLAPVASAESLNIDATTEVDAEAGGEEVHETVGGYVMADDTGALEVYQETNGCEGLQKQPTQACGEPDDRLFPPQVPEDPGAPGLPELPEDPGTPEIPELPEDPGAPGLPELPEDPGTPEPPQAPELPEDPGAPEIPELPGLPVPVPPLP